MLLFKTNKMLTLTKLYLENGNNSQNGSGKQFNYYSNQHCNSVVTCGGINLTTQHVNYASTNTTTMTNREPIRTYSSTAISSSHHHHNNARSSSSSSWDYEKRCTKMAIVTIVTFVLFNWLAGVNNVIEAFDLDVSGNAYRIPIGNLLVCLNRFIFFLYFSNRN